MTYVPVRKARKMTYCLCVRESGWVYPTLIDENRSVKGIHKSSKLSVREKKREVVAASFIIELLIGKKRREVSFGFNEHQSRKRGERETHPAVYISPQGSFPFLIFRLHFQRKLIKRIAVYADRRTHTQTDMQQIDLYSVLRHTYR